MRPTMSSSCSREKYPDIDVEVTLSNNEEMIAKLRATGGAGFDLAQPSHDRIFAAQHGIRHLQAARPFQDRHGRRSQPTWSRA